jgi:Bax protein
MIKYLIIIIIYISTLSSKGLPDTYYNINNKTAMKKYFFTYMSEVAQIQNNYILNDRKFIEKFYFKKNIINKTNKTYKKFLKIIKKYKLNINDSLEEYLLKIDIIPISLVIAQAAVESAWGKSRFIKEANNVFGQWTWKEKGLIPQQREEGKTHKIKIFDSIDSAVRGYMLNLNTNKAYKKLRKIRYFLRTHNKPITGIILSKTLINYSIKKEEYIKILDIIIIQNNLKRFNQ